MAATFTLALGLDFATVMAGLEDFATFMAAIFTIRLTLALGLEDFATFMAAIWLDYGLGEMYTRKMKKTIKQESVNDKQT